MINEKYQHIAYLTFNYNQIEILMILETKRLIIDAGKLRKVMGYKAPDRNVKAWLGKVSTGAVDKKYLYVSDVYNWETTLSQNSRTRTLVTPMFRKSILELLEQYDASHNSVNREGAPAVEDNGHTVTVFIRDTRRPATYHNVTKTYTADQLYTLQKGNALWRYPISSIFCIIEDLPKKPA